MVIVDTSAMVEFFREKGDAYVKLAVRALFLKYEATLCGPVEMEFLGGARLNEIGHIRSWFNILPYIRNDQKLWRKAAGNFAKLKSDGITAPWNDVLIATIAMESECRVYAVDKHFDSMAGIFTELRLYSPGYGGMYNPD
ncbi:MAG: PIN domain-containing protein [Verrucomicrobiota bacterium]